MAPPLPEQEVGIGAKWGIKEESTEVVYEIVSMEGRQVAAKVTVTVTESKQTPNKHVMTGGGGSGDITSGDITIDLGRILPVKCNLTQRLEMSGADEPGGRNTTLKARTDIRIEEK